MAFDLKVAVIKKRNVSKLLIIVTDRVARKVIQDEYDLLYRHGQSFLEDREARSFAVRTKWWIHSQDNLCLFCVGGARLLV
jgi:hypothetical protein